MHISIPNPDNTQSFNFIISFDPYGNIYFDGSQNSHDPYFTTPSSLIFQLNVDRDNKPYLDNSNYDIINENVPINKLKIVETNIIDEEEDDYIIEFDEDGNEILCNDDNPPFTFYYNNEDIQICERENGDICALYDSEIYDENKNPKIHSFSGDNASIYKLKIFLNDDIYFNCIDNSDIKYRLVINENGNILFIVV
jgi:hypothetical protein